MTTLDEDVIRMLSDVTDNERTPQDRIRNAIETASCCGQCGRALAASDPVWRKRIPLGRSLFSAYHEWVAPVCEQCKRGDVYQDPEPCQGCGRTVYNRYDCTRRRWVSCCQQCQRKIRVIEAREQRRAARPARACDACGEVFEPTRTDARFCSVACKQRAYRRRVTDVDLVTREKSKSRNARRRKR